MPSWIRCHGEGNSPTGTSTSTGSLAATDIAAVLKRDLFWRIPVGDKVDVDGLAARLLEL